MFMACMCVTLLTKNLISLHTAAVITTVNSLRAKNAREHWEKEFSAHYIQPVLGDLNSKVGKAMDLVVKDNKQGCASTYTYTYTHARIDKTSFLYTVDPHCRAQPVVFSRI